MRGFRDALIESFGGCQEAAHLFYLGTVFAASREIEALLARGQSVVLDRYFLSTQAYAAFRGSRVQLDETQGLLVPAHLTVLVEAPLSVRRARLIARGLSPADRETMEDEAEARLRAEHDRRLGLPVMGRVLRLDSAVATVDALVATVLDEVRGLG